MRVHIISDMEGVAGIVKWQQVAGGEKLWEEGRILYTEEINAAVRGAKAAGATEIVVMDNHGAGGPHSFNSLVHDLLDPACEYVVHKKCPSRSTSPTRSARAVETGFGRIGGLICWRKRPMATAWPVATLSR